MSELTERLKAKQEKALPIIADPSKDMNTRLREKQKLREQGINVRDPKESDISQRKAFLAQDIGQGTLGSQSVGAGVRFDLGLSDTFEEKKAKFLDKFPEGQFVESFEPPKATGQVVEPGRGGSTILFQRHPDESFAELDPGALDKSEILADFADLSGEIPAAAMELIFTRGGKLVKQLLGIAAGNVTGDALKEAVEGVRGYRKETIGEFAKRTTERAAVAVVGGGATVVVSGPINAIRGAPALAVARGAGVAQRAAKKLGVPGLLPSQIARSPIIRKIGGQASATIKTIGDYVSRQQSALVRSFSGLREADLAKVLRGELENLHDAAGKQIIAAAKIRPRSLSETGGRIQQGIAEYDELATTLVGTAYKDARTTGTPEFDLTSMKSVAQQMKAGIRGVDESGKEIVLSGVDKELDDILQKVIDLDPSLPPTQMPDGTIVDGTDQLRALRSQLWDMKTPPPGEIARQSQKEASRMFGALTNTLKKPTNADPVFLAKWEKANKLASGRFDVMEKLMVINASRSETPAMLASKLSKPDQVDNLRVLQEIMPPSKYREFQEGAKAEFISPRNVDGLTKRLDSFDQSTLDVLLTKADQKEMRNIGQQIDNLNRADIKGALERQTSVSGVLDDLVDSGNTPRIRQLIEDVGTSPDAPINRSIRAGLMERVWKKSVKVIEGNPTLDKKALAAEMKALRESGALKFLSFKDIRMLKKIDRVLEFVPQAADTGTSIQAAEAAAGIRGLSSSAFMTVLEHIGTGRLLTSSTFQRIALGSGRKPFEFSKLRVMGAVLAQVNRDLEGEKPNQ
ncbi:MAG: hypothetical protein ABUK15_07300 [Anaerolineales bacterium]